MVKVSRIRGCGGQPLARPRVREMFLRFVALARLGLFSAWGILVPPYLRTPVPPIDSAKLLHLRRALTRFDDFRMGEEKLFLEILKISRNTFINRSSNHRRCLWQRWEVASWHRCLAPSDRSDFFGFWGSDKRCCRIHQPLLLVRICCRNVSLFLALFFLFLYCE